MKASIIMPESDKQYRLPALSNTPKIKNKDKYATLQTSR